MLGTFDGVLYGQESADPVLARIGLNSVMRHGTPGGIRREIAAIGPKADILVVLLILLR